MEFYTYQIWFEGLKTFSDLQKATIWRFSSRTNEWKESRVGFNGGEATRMYNLRYMVSS
jgi:hypothetical protein